MASLNLQQQPKSRQYLECFRARPGHKIVQLDFDALEPKITAYFSRDKNLMNLYGPGYYEWQVIQRLEQLNIKYRKTEKGIEIDDQSLQQMQEISE